MYIAIKSSGIGKNTEIYNTKTGELLQYVTEINWHISAKDPAIATVKILAAPIQAIAKLDKKATTYFQKQKREKKITIEELIEWDRNKKSI